MIRITAWPLWEGNPATKNKALSDHRREGIRCGQPMMGDLSANRISLRTESETLLGVRKYDSYVPNITHDLLNSDGMNG